MTWFFAAFAVLGVIKFVLVIAPFAVVLYFFAFVVVRANKKIKDLASSLRHAMMENFLLQMANEKPIRFTPQQLAGFTGDYSSLLGTGGFGTVYKGALPNGLPWRSRCFRATSTGGRRSNSWRRWAPSG